MLGTALAQTLVSLSASTTYLRDEGSLSCLGLRFDPEEAPEPPNLLGLDEQLLGLVLPASGMVVLVLQTVARTRGAGPAGDG